MRGWHFCRESRRLGYGDGREIRVGETLAVYGEPKLCDWGLHASVHVSDALIYAFGPILCRVELGGTVVRGGGKAVATERTTLAMVDATTMLHDYAIWCAERALALILAPDPRSINALAVKRRWLVGEADDDDLLAARAAAEEAVWAAEAEAAAEQAARAVARAAAGKFAWTTAWTAARAAAEASAREAAWEAETKVQRAELTQRANLLMEEAA